MPFTMCRKTEEQKLLEAKRKARHLWKNGTLADNTKDFVRLLQDQRVVYPDAQVQQKLTRKDYLILAGLLVFGAILMYLMMVYLLAGANLG